MANMRERYETISLVDLKEMAKFRGIKGVSAMKKADIIDAMVAKDEEESAANAVPAEAETKASILPAAIQAKSKAGHPVSRALPGITGLIPFVL